MDGSRPVGEWRALTDNSPKRLVGVNTIRNLEATGSENVRGRTGALDAMVAALKLLGVIFVEENGEGPGVRLRKGKSSE